MEYKFDEIKGNNEDWRGDFLGSSNTHMHVDEFWTQYIVQACFTNKLKLNQTSKRYLYKYFWYQVVRLVSASDETLLMTHGCMSKSMIEIGI